MKKNKLLAGLLAVSLLVGMAVPAMAEESVNAATNTEPTHEAKEATAPTFTLETLEKPGFYANGTPITVVANPANAKGCIIKWGDGEGESKAWSKPVIIYGGGDGKPDQPYFGKRLASSNITINGGNILTVYGGGAFKTAVTDAKITVNGGTFGEGFQGGGASFAIGIGDAGTSGQAINSLNRVDNATVVVNDGKASALYAGGMGHGYVGTTSLTINGGDWGWVTGGGSNGYTGDATVTINGGTLKVVQSGNRGTVNKTAFVMSDGTVAKFHLGGETGDTNVYAKINNVTAEITGGTITKLLAGQNGDGTTVNSGKDMALEANTELFAATVTDVSINKGIATTIEKVITDKYPEKDLPSTADKSALIKAIADARAYEKTIVVSTNGEDVAKTKLWATEDNMTAYSKAIDSIEYEMGVATTQAEVNALIAELNTAKTTLGAANGSKEPVKETPTVSAGSDDKAGTGTTEIKGAGESAAAGDDIVATLPAESIKEVITAANTAEKSAEITVTLPAAEKGTVTKIEVPKEVFTAAAAATNDEAKKIVFEVTNSESASQVKWEFDTSKGVPSSAINLMATPGQDAKVVLDTAVTGLDTDTVGNADLIKFEHSGTIPAGTKVTVPTTVTVAEGAKAYAYSISVNGKVDLSSKAIVTIANGMATFEPKHFSDILISATEIKKIVIPGPPVDQTPSYRPSYSGSATPTTTPSTDLTTIIENTAISANTVKGTKVEVPSSISDPTFDSKEIALNAPEAKAFVDTAANSGFAFAKVFQMNLFDGKTKVTKVEDGKVKISIPFAGKAGYEYVVLRYETNGGITAMPALYKDGQITFTTNHFSLYAIAVKSTNKNLFADTTVKPGTPTPGGTTSVPQTSACTLTKLF